MIEVIIDNEEHQVLQTILLKEEQAKKEAYLQRKNKVYKSMVLNKGKLDSIFERATELLQKEGFDINYNPTYVGRILERLIDKFTAID